MAGQSDAADDLIAELAKLMAQDAHGEGSSAAPATPLYPIRIPGEAPQPAQAKADLAFVRALANPAPEQPRAATPAEPVVTAAAAPVPAEELPEPFKFDFDFAPAKRQPEPAAAKPEPVLARPEVQPAPAPVSVAPTPSAPVPQAIDHDSIADLIAAELAIDSSPATVPAPVSTSAASPAPAPVTAAPVVAMPAAAAPEAPPAPAAEPRRSNPGPGWTPTTVAANLGSQQRPARPALRSVNLQPVARSEQDRFKVPPVFGLGTAPAKSTETVVPVTEHVAIEPQAQPTAFEPQAFVRPTEPAPVVAAPTPAADDSALGRDPIDEIESLIGRAMRVEFDKPAAQPVPVVEDRAAPSPALRSLASPAAPPSTGLSAADEAVLAAAQATGAQVGWVEAPEVSDPEPVKRQRTERTRREGGGITRAVAGPLVAVTLLLAAGFGLYWVLGLGGRDSGAAVPLLTADATPIKQVAPTPAPDATPAPQSVVFNEIDGVVPGAEEQLVSRDQADVNEVTQVATATPADVSEEGLANRKVRTVTVRPDGSIVSSDDSTAGSAILPVNRPNVPAVPGAETASPELMAAVNTDAVSAAPATAVVPAPTAPAEVAAAPTPAVTPVEPGSTVPVVDIAGNPVAGKTTVVPRLRPAGLSASAPTTVAPVNAVIDPATTPAPLAAAPVAETAPVAAAPVEQPAAVPAGATEVAALPNNAPAYVQLASQRSEAEARQTAQAMVTRFGPLFGGANMEVQRVDLGAKGIYYRVRVPAQSLDQANNICTNVKAAGGDCFTM